MSNLDSDLNRLTRIENRMFRAAGDFDSEMGRKSQIEYAAVTFRNFLKDFEFLLKSGYKNREQLRSRLPLTNLADVPEKGVNRFFLSVNFQDNAMFVSLTRGIKYDQSSGRLEAEGISIGHYTYNTRKFISYKDPAITTHGHIADGGVISETAGSLEHSVEKGYTQI